jgi:hypothetical protein
MSAVLFGRTGVLTLGTTQIKFAQTSGTPGLKVEFNVSKNLKPEPNKVTIKVWNLAPTTRAALESSSLIPVQLDVGYAGDNHTIYLGQLRSAMSDRDGPDIITTIASQDSAAAFSTNRINNLVPKNANALQLRELPLVSATCSKRRRRRRARQAVPRESSTASRPKS